MARPAKGQVVVLTRARGRVCALRFRAYGRREYLTLGTAQEGWTHEKAQTELEERPRRRAPRHLASARERARASAGEGPDLSRVRLPVKRAKQAEIRPNTARSYRNALTHHLLPFFHEHLLANGRLYVRDAKTDAGTREVDLLHLLREELAEHKAASAPTGPEDRVFVTSGGRPRDRYNLRQRVLAPVVKRADELLAERDAPPLPIGISPHKLRHTFASLLVALGNDPASVMAQLGHTDPAFTLRVYTHINRRAPRRARAPARACGGPRYQCYMGRAAGHCRQGPAGHQSAANRWPELHLLLLSSGRAPELVRRRARQD